MLNFLKRKRDQVHVVVVHPIVVDTAIHMVIVEVIEVSLIVIHMAIVVEIVVTMVIEEVTLIVMIAVLHIVIMMIVVTQEVMMTWAVMQKRIQVHILKVSMEDSQEIASHVAVILERNIKNKNSVLIEPSFFYRYFLFFIRRLFRT